MEKLFEEKIANTPQSSFKGGESIAQIASNNICIKPTILRSLPQIDSASSLIADKNLTIPNEIVSGLLHAKTKGVLAGSPKIGKSWMILYLAVCIAAGVPFIKWKTIQGNVLYINLEIPKAFMKKRLESIKERMNLPSLDNLSVWTLRGQNADFDSLLEYILSITQEKKYSLIILDPIYKLMIGQSEISSSSVGMLGHYIDRLIEKTGAAVVYAHHFTKGNGSKKKATDRISGSGLFARDADTIITLTEHEEENCYTVEITLRNFEPQDSFVVEMDFPIIVERPDLNPADLAKNNIQEDDDLEPVLELLDEKPLTVGQWQAAAQAKGYSRATFFRMKKKLELGKRIQFDQREKTCSRMKAINKNIPAESVNHPQTLEKHETSETIDTSESQKTAMHNNQGDGLMKKSEGGIESNDLKSPCLIEAIPHV